MATMLDDVTALSLAQMRKLMGAKDKEEIEIEVERTKALAAAANSAISATNAQVGIFKTYVNSGATAQDVARRFRGLLGPASETEA